MSRDDDWDWCGVHDEPWAACRHLHDHRVVIAWPELVGIGVALLMAFVLLMGLAR
jgi:hypothetical protein